MMTDERYVDGVGGVAVISGSVKVDFFTYLIDPETNPQDPPSEMALRLVMSPDGFLRTHRALENLLQELKSRGLVGRRTKDDATAGNGTEAGEASQANTSPNFSSP